MQISHGYICEPCAEDRGGAWPKGKRGSLHEGKCPYCFKTAMLASITEWQWEENKRIMQ